MANDEAAVGPVHSAEIDAFLAPLPANLRTALEHLRAVIGQAAPDAVETIAYSVPAFKYRGRPLVSFSAGRTGKGPCALYVQSPPLLETFRPELAGYDTSKGTIHFEPAQPLADDLVTRIVRARLAETDGARKR